MTAHKKTQEKSATTMSGGLLLLIGWAGFIAVVYLFVQGIMAAERDADGLIVLTYIGGAVVTLLASSGSNTCPWSAHTGEAQRFRVLQPLPCRAKQWPQ